MPHIMPMMKRFVKKVTPYAQNTGLLPKK